MATVKVAGGPMKRDISQLARICERLFLQYTDPELECAKDRTRAEIQLQRFNAWASYLGVFAEDNASLDRRLEHSDEIQSLVLQLLLLLQENLEFVNKPESEVALDGTISEALDTVEATINRLNRLGSTIRKYSPASLDSRVKAFTERHGDANYTELAKQIVYSRYRTAPPSLQEQLALSMSARRQRLRYIRRQQEKLTTHKPQKGNIESRDRPGAECPRLPSPTQTDETAPYNAPADGPSRGKKRALNNRPLVGFLAPTSANTKASTFSQTPSLVAKVQKSHGTSVVSSSKQSTTFMIEDLDNYPDPPKKEAGKPEPTCPFCFQPLQDTILKPNNWRKHVDQDLHPFVCISEKCNQQPPLAFPDSEMWAHHMREAHSAKWTQLIHKPFVWRCDVGHLDNVGDFADEESFEEHLDSQHGDCSPAARKAIFSACKVFQKRKRNVCPLCGYYVSDPEPGEASVSAEAKPKVDRAAQLRKLAKHIAGHLRRLAFDSSRNLDCVPEEDDSSQGSIGTSNPIERDGGISLANDFSQPEKAPRLPPTPILSVIPDAGYQQQKDLKAKQEQQSPSKYVEGIVITPSTPTSLPSGPTSLYEESSYSQVNLQVQLMRSCQKIKNPMHAGRQGEFLPKAKLDDVINETSVFRELAARSPGERPSRLKSDAEAVCAEKTLKLSDGKTKTQSYRQIFAILVLIGKSRSIQLFMKEVVSDLDLPLIEHSDDADPNYNKLFRGDWDGNTERKSLQCTQDWEPGKRRQFCDYQWMVLAPFFSLGSYNHVKHYNLKDQHLLPFIDGKQFWSPDSMMSQSSEISSGFSQVFRVWIHSDHHNFHEYGLDAQRGFAIKQLQKMDEHVFRKEVDMLKKFTGEGSHPHVVSVLATYEQSGRYHLIFHWADGDLLRYWTKICPKPTFNYDTVLWVAKQLSGLVGGLCRFHRHYTDDHDASNRMKDVGYDGKERPRRRTRLNDTEPPPMQGAGSSEPGPRNKKEQFGRHGGLKPQNILLFPSPKDERGVLKISDLGQAELHSASSKTRWNTKDICTLTYRPPETDVEPLVIRQSGDIWSLGCIFLEFVSWALGGMVLVEEFQQRRMSWDQRLQMNSDTFYERENVETLQHVGARLKGAVTEHIKLLRSRPNCTDYFKDVLDLISEGMLVIDDPSSSRRHKCGTIHSRLQSAYEKCQNQRLYAVGAQGAMDIG